MSAATAAAWVGVSAQDPFGELVGDVAAVLRDRESGAAEWLVLVESGKRRGRLVPLAGTVPTGQRVRVVPTAALVRAAPEVDLGEDLDVETERKAAAHYGMTLDTDASPSGLLRENIGDHRDRQQTPALSAAAVAARRKELIAGLRAAHAMEQGSLKLLSAMRWRARDEELVHDLALHHKATNDHAEAIRLRLDELEAARGRPLDWLAKFGAYLEAQRGRLRRVPEPHDISEAYELERSEIAVYDRLGRLARELGDERTAAVCAANRADEVAMAITLRNHRLHADPGARRGEESPFAAPEELTELAPGS